MFRSHSRPSGSPHAVSVGAAWGQPESIVNGKCAVTADTALRLGTYFQVSPELWLDLQSDYDLRVLRRTAGPRITAQVRPRAA